MLKNKVVKFIISLLIIFILTANYPLAFSVDIDGLHTGDEWDGATVNKLLDGESNSGVNFGLVKTLTDNKESALYLCFMHKDPSLEIDNLNTGVSVSVDNSDCFEISASSSPNYYDTSEHSFGGAVTVDENNGATTEVRIGFKFGLPQKINCTVRFIDSSGALSNLYSFTVINDEYVETTELIITQEEPETTEKETTEKITTKKNTTKARKATTKKSVKKTEKKTTVRITEKTTAKKNKKPAYSYSYTRKIRTTAARKLQTTAKQVTSPAKVYYHEKEVIISHVYITAEDTSTTVKHTALPDTTTALYTEIATPDEPEIEIKSSFSLSEGTKKKAIIGVLAAISFTIIAAAGTRSAKKSSDNNENSDTP